MQSLPLTLAVPAATVTEWPGPGQPEASNATVTGSATVTVLEKLLVANTLPGDQLWRQLPVTVTVARGGPAPGWYHWQPQAGPA